jgi:hypothetical protein
MLVSLALVRSNALSAQTFPVPTKLWAAQISPTDIMLSWAKVPGAVLYRIHSVTGASSKLLGEPGASGDSYVVRGLRQFYPRGLVTLGELGETTARQCTMSVR